VLAGNDDGLPDYIGLLREMCDDFDAFQQRGRYTLGSHVRDPSQFMLVYGLNCHAHYMVRRCLPLLAESTLAAVPILRSVFECGVMAQWLRWVPGSEVSLLEESRRQTQALAKDLIRSRFPHRREEGARGRRELAEEWPDLSEMPRAPSARFAEMCNAFDGAGDLYSRYRVLSKNTHAGINLAGAWLLLGDAGPRVLDEPREVLPLEVVGYIAVLALGLSSRAFDDLVAESPRSDFLDGVEQRAELVTRLQPLDHGDRSGTDR
jgi:hypothetical protein